MANYHMEWKIGNFQIREFNSAGLLRSDAKIRGSTELHEPLWKTQMRFEHFWHIDGND